MIRYPVQSSPRTSLSKFVKNFPKVRKKSNKHRRSRSGGRDDDRGKGGDHSVETIKLTDGDAAFLLGKGGKTKHKIAKVSGADLELFERDLTLEIRGTEKQRRAARKSSPELVFALLIITPLLKIDHFRFT